MPQRVRKLTPSLTPEQVAALQALVAQQRQQTVQDPAGAPSPWTVRHGDQDLQFRDPAELQNRLAEIDRQHESALAAERVRAQAAEQQAEAARAQAAQLQQAHQVPAGQPAEFDKEQYARLFLEDPRKAQRYWMEHDTDLKNFFGGIAAKVVQLENDLSTERQERAAELFVSQTNDYVATPENFKAIESIIKGQNLDWNYANLKMAWAYAKDQGVAKVNTQNDDQSAAAQQVPFIAGPPPTTRRSSQVEPDDIMAQFEGMTPERQKAYLESLSAR